MYWWLAEETGEERSTVIFNYCYSFQCRMVLSYSVTAETASERPGSGLRCLWILGRMIDLSGSPSPLPQCLSHRTAARIKAGDAVGAHSSADVRRRPPQCSAVRAALSLPSRGQSLGTFKRVLNSYPHPRFQKPIMCGEQPQSWDRCRNHRAHRYMFGPNVGNNVL